MVVKTIFKDEKYEKYAIKNELLFRKLKDRIHFKNFHSFEYRNFETTGVYICVFDFRRDSLNVYKVKNDSSEFSVSTVAYSKLFNNILLPGNNS